MSFANMPKIKDFLTGLPPWEAEGQDETVARAASTINDSPIERSLAVRLFERGRNKLLTRAEWDALEDPGDRYAYYVPQFEIGRYRLDFAVFYRDQKLNIECDGREFHSSAAAKAHDGDRNDFLRRQGWEVLRYDGGYLHHKPEACADEIDTLLDAELAHHWETILLGDWVTFQRPDDLYQVYEGEYSYWKIRLAEKIRERGGYRVPKHLQPLVTDEEFT